MNPQARKHAALAAIEYHGIPGFTQRCVDAVQRLIQYNDRIAKAQILTNSNRHCLLLTVNDDELIAVKSGLTSGYSGEGPRAFSYVLRLLLAYGVEIVEQKVRRDLLDRVDNCCLTRLDLKKLENSHPVPPSQFLSDYLIHDDMDLRQDDRIWINFPHVIPFSIVDHRIVDLAKSFWQSTDEKLLTGYRRLEDIVRMRIGVDEYGSRLLGIAFSGEKSKLKWGGIIKGEQNGRAGLFTSAYQAFRNPRAHKEMIYSDQEALSEFLLLNHLYRLESESFVSEETERTSQR